MKEILFFYIPCPDEETAARLAGSLLEAKLIACSNIYQARSYYTWQGSMQNESEHIMIVKSLMNKKEAIYRALDEWHPYEVPAIVSYPAEVNDSYHEWMVEVMG